MTVSSHSASKKQENSFLNLIFNIILPSVLMIKGAQWFSLSAELSIAIALLFPITYGSYDLITRKEYNILSIIGIVSVLLTGGIGLLKLPKEWIAFKEAAIPFIIGVLIIASLRSRRSLLRLMLYNEKIMQVEKVDTAIKEQNQEEAFKKLFKQCTLLLASSFFLSAGLNFSLAKYLIQSETGTQAFTEELGKMTAWSFPVIALPCMIITVLILYKLLNGIRRLSGLPMEDIFVGEVNNTPAKSANGCC